MLATIADTRLFVAARHNRVKHASIEVEDFGLAQIEVAANEPRGASSEIPGGATTRFAAD